MLAQSAKMGLEPHEPIKMWGRKGRHEAHLHISERLQALLLGFC